MKRILLTGMSGTGKSTLIEELQVREYTAVDLDQPGWSANDAAGNWSWRAERVAELLATDTSDVLFLSGCSENQGQFYPQLDHVILLSAPAGVLVRRILTRTNNQYGKRSEELADVLHYRETVEPLLRRGATHEVDVSAPLAEVVETILLLVGERPLPRG